jgi:hypothetical protein
MQLGAVPGTIFMIIFSESPIGVSGSRAGEAAGT